MKMVKSLLLGSAAGLVAIAGAQAADLPVKAKPVEYVKVCSIYGQGFYYIPGTETCLKVGGYVRMDIGFNAAGSHGPYVSGAGGRDNREDTSWYETRVRGIFSFDARSQTEWGTLRAYMRGGWEQNSGDANYRGIQYLDRAFIQFGGLTAGKTQSFFGFYSNANNYSTLQGGGQSDAGLNLLAYTFQFPGGFSATISLEEANHHRSGIWDANNAAGNAFGAPDVIPGLGGSGNPLTLGAIPGNVSGGLPGYGNYTANRWPDVVGNLRVDQPWGSAQLSGALHEASGSYHGANLLGGEAPDGFGFAVQAGLKFNLPWAQGDEFWVQGTWARGATNYLGYNTFVHTGTQFAMFSGATPIGACITLAAQGQGSCGTLGAAWAFDAVFDVNNGLALTEGWSFLANIQHYWTPALRTSIFGHITSVEYGATGRAIFCGGPANAPAAGQISTATLATCNPDFRTAQIGVRTIWSPARQFDIGVEVLYTRLDQNHVGFWNVGSVGARPAGGYTAQDQDTWSGTVRFQRNFFP